MNVIERFLQSEINTQKLYDDSMDFITSFHIRNGEFEEKKPILLYFQNMIMDMEKRDPCS